MNIFTKNYQNINKYNHKKKKKDQMNFTYNIQIKDSFYLYGIFFHKNLTHCGSIAYHNHKEKLLSRVIEFCLFKA